MPQTTDQKKIPLLLYFNATLPYYYFYFLPLIIAFIVVSFDFSFQGIFPTTQAANISSQHKFLNDFYMLCSAITMMIIFINYLRIPLNTQHIHQIRQHFASLTPNQQSLFSGLLGLIFLIFILSFFSLIWFLIDDTIPTSYQDFNKSDFLTYLHHFAHPYISNLTMSLQYALNILIALLLIQVLNTRKYVK